MAGTFTDIKLDDTEFMAKLDWLTVAFYDLIPIMKITGAAVVASIQKNFEDEGRPDGWDPLSPVTIAMRGGGDHILQVAGPAGGLLGSINYQAHSDRVEIGTNKIYAAVHQFGHEPGNIPARPFIMVQPGDWTEIGKEIIEYLEGGQA